jgi:hypothetical protein
MFYYSMVTLALIVLCKLKKFQLYMGYNTVELSIKIFTNLQKFTKDKF